MADVVVVEVGGRRIAVPTASVREVTTLATLTPVPGAPPAVAGLTQVRGQILPVLDVDGDGARAAPAQDTIVIVERGPVRAALRVDRVTGVEPSADPVAELDLDELLRGVRGT
jgi:purine-binding chemotaxis protein CheW